MTCIKDENEPVLLRVDGQWVPYTGSTSTRKLYYRASEAKRSGSKSFYVYDFSWEYCGYNKKVTGAIFPNKFYRQLSCCSINGVEAHNLPHMILLGGVECCKMLTLGNGSGSVCTYCGKQEKHNDLR